ncbi:SRPBCC domain-containing protein [Rubellimicrobium sp. CFH 75288]|uniref:SRPBCC domain-containing protein n=1 Tax=Rubellimicrobium sp. CFH 75288 TaxID=2697034 RepID=UPI001411BB0D|nr:SRPBCC domain-containing protein [Rubellimicrobium sp. CFH 75288]NAZ35368.1 hypothetical protein [Rubellimicrobium sp. CFH 75288]
MSADLHLHRVLPAPPAAVWACWTDPAQLPHWFAPRPVTTIVHALDPRPGGAFQVEMIVDGQSHGSEPGCFLEVVPERRLVWTSALGPGFRPAATGDAPFVFTAIVEMAGHPDGGTDYRVTVLHRDADAAAAHEAMGFGTGWGIMTDQLGARAAALSPAGAPDLSATLSRRLRASPERVWQAWTDPDALPRWFGPEGWTCETEAIGIREGGEWRFTMRGHGMAFPNRHRWIALEPFRRIVFLMDGGEGSGPPMRVEVVLEPTPEGGTLLRQTLTFPDAASLEAARSHGFEARGAETLDKLARALGE